jgi:hypothetical protein
MNPVLGMLLVFGLMVLIFFGPEWGVRFARKPKKFKRLVYLGDSRNEPVAGRRRTNRFEGSQGTP